MRCTCYIMCTRFYPLKVLESYFSFIGEKSIHYDEITVSQKTFFSKFSLNFLFLSYFHSYNNATNTH